MINSMINVLNPRWLKKLVEQGKINPDETTVAYITGNGLKTPQAIAPLLGLAPVIRPTLDAFDAYLGTQA